MLSLAGPLHNSDQKNNYLDSVCRYFRSGINGNTDFVPLGRGKSAAYHHVSCSQRPLPLYGVLFCFSVTFNTSRKKRHHTQSSSVFVPKNRGCTAVKELNNIPPQFVTVVCAPYLVPLEDVAAADDKVGPSRCRFLDGVVCQATVHLDVQVRVPSTQLLHLRHLKKKRKNNNNNNNNQGQEKKGGRGGKSAQLHMVGSLRGQRGQPTAEQSPLLAAKYRIGKNDRSDLQSDLGGGGGKRREQESQHEPDFKLLVRGSVLWSNHLKPTSTQPISVVSSPNLVVFFTN